MAVNTEAIGKTYPPTLYAVGREKIKEYAYAVGETNSLHLDHEAARAAGLTPAEPPGGLSSLPCAQRAICVRRSPGGPGDAPPVHIIPQGVDTGRLL